jgi:hypothetical protein
MSRGSRVGYGREMGPRCRGPKSPANVELLQVIEGPPGQPGGPSTIFGIGLVNCRVWMPSRMAVSSRRPRKVSGPKMFQKTKEFG